MGRERACSGEINTKVAFCEEKKRDSDEMGSAVEFEVSYLKPDESCIEDEGVIFAV